MAIDMYSVVELFVVGLRYLHAYAGINTIIGSTADPIVNFVGAIGTNKVALETDVAIDSTTRNFTEYNGGFSYSNTDILFSANLRIFILKNISYSRLVHIQRRVIVVYFSGTTTVKSYASYYHLVSPLTSTAVGVEFSHSFITNENTLTIGGQHALNPLITANARCNNYGKLSALLQHEWHPRSLFTVSRKIDSRAIEKSAKIGLALTLKPSVVSEIFWKSNFVIYFSAGVC